MEERQKSPGMGYPADAAWMRGRYPKMPLSTQLIFVFCFLCSAGYVLFGIVQMVLPRRALPVYRFFLGSRRFAKAEPVMSRLTRWHWRLIGAAYIVFGMLVTWVLTVNLAASLRVR